MQPGGPVEPITLVGEQGQELIINGVVVPHEETERLLRLGLIPDQEATHGGEGGGMEDGRHGHTPHRQPPIEAPFTDRGNGIGTRSASEEAGPGRFRLPRSGRRCRAGFQSEAAATVLASMPAAVAQAAAEQGRAQVEETQQTNDET